jgi:hypothetical protein
MAVSITRKWVVRILIVAVLVTGVAFLERLREKAQQRSIRYACVSNMQNICMAGSLWAEEHGGRFPTNLVCLSNELSAPKLLCCPADPSRSSATNWASMTADNISYELLAPGLAITNTSTVVICCMIHGTVGYADGNVEIRVQH